ncbi:hypothetical protein A2955_01115 [Candidatus Woesebacteria bacterium RIFCSPLOWO2_01_FULL_37_19]|uniref:TGS domain-containing protein n=1 Tax=Candidatus Woesebacteria bacterium RIFCSPLOWO2_01_FULL_37_19 TaxID=1802514 RepID=A0A1F8B2S6_9BACT|nr:MAG: hypothetical protein A2955_01115 [Candidatus Woesebacteria bacterium RIFCSPLOWO2_01_FULL_37_19]
MKSKPDLKFSELIADYKSYMDNKSDTRLLKKAWDFAKLAHTGQKRLTGVPYVNHPLETAKILTSWKLDAATIAAGLLHDTVEDGGATEEDLIKEFGIEISQLVAGVTKVSNVKLRGSKDQEFVENLRKMFLAMAKDLRVVLVKLADRMHNMRTLYAIPKEKQERIARETLEVFAPLAERLGMGEVKAKLDDLAFPYVYQEKYKLVKKESLIHYKKAEETIKTMKRAILRRAAELEVKVRVNGRKKHLYSLWLKLERPEISWDFEKIHDIVALRVLVDSVAECYTALGVIHNLYKPVPHLGVSDFIAQPKPNGYQSIHTKVFGPKGKIVEVQIRTYEMHESAEYGIASHWAYSQAKSRGISGELLENRGVAVDSEKLSWVKQLADWQKELADSEEFLRAVKFDALSHRNFVFSPLGDVYNLPKGSTPVDFAYAVHTQLGSYIKGVKVDGKVVPLDFKLRSGQVVEIIKSKSSHPPRSDWLKFVVTTTARKEINKYLRNLRIKE